MKKGLVIILLMSLIATTLGFGLENQINLRDVNSSNDIYKHALSLVDRFPGLLSIENLGRSIDGRPIYVVKMSMDIDNVENEYVTKMHHFIESGIHSRENIGPNLLIAMIEDYCIDVFDKDHLPGVDSKEMLSSHVFHFIPLSNPDGYDLALFGVGKMFNFYTVDYLLALDDQDFSNYKANVHGVDLNRNFPGEFYHLKDDHWYDIWNIQHNSNRSFQPSGAYYFGSESGSEPETKILMDYALRYDFREYLSFHSKGQVVYWDQWMLPEDYREIASNYGRLASNTTGYDKMPEDNLYSTSSGYLTDYTSMNTLKPSLTIELLPYSTNLPTTTDHFEAEYELVKTLPLVIASYSEQVGYYPYRLYVNGKYIRDFVNEEYAFAVAARENGYIIEASGEPVMCCDERLTMSMFQYFSGVKINQRQ